MLLLKKMLNTSRQFISNYFIAKKRCRFCRQFASLILVVFILFLLYLAAQALPDWLNSSIDKKNQKFFIVEDAHTVLDKENYYIDAKIKMDFTPVVINALENGVALTIAIELNVQEKNNFFDIIFFDSLVKESILYFEIRYHALTEIYRIKNIKTAKAYQFNNRKEALALLGNISHAHLIASQKLNPDKHHQVNLRVLLDIWKLPEVLRAQASLSNDWHLRSNWLSWMLN